MLVIFAPALWMQRHSKNVIGQLAQLVQSIWFTPRGSGVRIPHRPQIRRKALHKCRALLFKSEPYSFEIAFE